MKLLYSTFLATLISFSVIAQKTFLLYEGKIPGSKTVADEEKTEYKDGIVRVSNITVPTISVYLPEKGKANGSAIIIFPGGGYRINALSHEGVDVAKKLAEFGITAFVVKYRLPNDVTMENKEVGPLQDAQQAIKFVRERGTEWKIKPNRIGVMGFSAGGHLASTLGTHYARPLIENQDQTSLRPDFLVLIYPVINLSDSIAHLGSREQLLGKNPTRQKINLYSNDLQVNAETPTSFLVHASDDKAVSVKNSLLFYHRLLHYNIPAELHVYEGGGHGFGMNNPTTKDKWIDRLEMWLDSNGLLD